MRVEHDDRADVEVAREVRHARAGLLHRLERALQELTSQDARVAHGRLVHAHRVVDDVKRHHEATLVVGGRHRTLSRPFEARLERERLAVVLLEVLHVERRASRDERRQRAVAQRIRLAPEAVVRRHGGGRFGRVIR